MKFIDTAKVMIQSGNGGKGLVSFRREKFVPKGGPDGGNGGKGGDVVFIPDPQMSTLLDFKYNRIYKAKNGAPGGNSRKSGRGGADIEIKVPCGTLVKRLEDGEIIADLVTPYKKIVVLEGGKGGHGNSEFATPTKQTPHYAEPGLSGKEMEVVLELKLIADVGIVGFPNAGKSTLISVISAAKPKIADYPFTTLVPNLGIVRIDLSKSYTVADIPGLIEGAAEGKGLGTQFLRHVERTKVLLFMLDPFHGDIKADYKILTNELKKYNPQMLKKQQIICISKADAMDDSMKKEMKKVSFKSGKIKPIIISSVTGENIEEIKFKLWDIIASGVVKES
jgi:GTP-binding protein